MNQSFGPSLKVGVDDDDRHKPDTYNHHRVVSSTTAGQVVTSPSVFASTTSTNQTLVIPLADEWRDGFFFRDNQGRFVAKVIKHEKIGRLAGGDPIFRVILGNEQDEIQAVIVRKMEKLQDVYVISSVTANFPGQASEESKGNNKKTLHVYPYAKIPKLCFLESIQ